MGLESVSTCTAGFVNHVCRSEEYSTEYPVIAVPPLENGTVHDMIILVLSTSFTVFDVVSPTAVTFSGLDGTMNVVIDDIAGNADMLFRAFTESTLT